MNNRADGIFLSFFMLLVSQGERVCGMRTKIEKSQGHGFEVSKKYSPHSVNGIPVNKISESKMSYNEVEICLQIVAVSVSKVKYLTKFVVS